MPIYYNQRSSSFIDLCPRSLSFNISNFFSSKNSRPLEAKFHMQPPWNVRMKICSNVKGHMTKMASRPIYMHVLKNLHKSPSSEPRGRWPWNLLYSIGYSRTTQFVQMILTIFMTWSNLFPNASTAWVTAYTAYSHVFPSNNINNDQELSQSDPISCPQNQNGKTLIHKLTAGKARAVNRMNSSSLDRWSFSYLNLTKICHSHNRWTKV